MEVCGVGASAVENIPEECQKEYLSCRLPDTKFLDFLAELHPDVLVHCAGRASVPRSLLAPDEDFEGNAYLAFNILNLIRSLRLRTKFILLSSAAVYGGPAMLPISEDVVPQPLSPYGYHKRIAEIACEEHSRVFGLRTACLRIFSAYGPGLQRQVVWDIVRKLLSKKDVLLQGTGSESRDFVHARDVARAVFAVVERAPMGGEVYNVGSGCETSIKELSKLVVDALQSKREICFDSILPVGTPSRWQADIRRLGLLGYRPSVGLDAGVREYCDWAKSLLGVVAE